MIALGVFSIALWVIMLIMLPLYRFRALMWIPLAIYCVGYPLNIAAWIGIGYSLMVFAGQKFNGE